MTTLRRKRMVPARNMGWSRPLIPPTQDPTMQSDKPFRRSVVLLDPRNLTARSAPQP